MKGSWRRHLLTPVNLILFFLLILGFPALGISQVTLRMIGPEDIGGAWAEIIARFQKRHPDIHVTYISGPWSSDERQNMYIRSFLGGRPFELVYMDVVWTARFAEKGWIIPLDEWFTPAMREEFFPGDIKAGSYKGRCYRVPVRSDVGVLYYRKDLLRAPPGTWEAFEDYCKKYAASPERYGLVFQGMQYEGLVCNYLEYLWGAGGAVLDQEGRVRLDSPENRSALAFMKKIIDSGWAPQSVITFQEQHTLEYFAQGKSLMMRNWPYAWNILRRSPLRDKTGIAPLFHRPGGSPAGTLGGWGLGIARGTRAPAAAWRFMEFAVSSEAQKILHFRRGAVPSRKSLFQDGEILQDSPHYRELYTVLLTARSRPVHPEYPRISATIQKHVSAVLVGAENPREAASAMNRSVEGIVSGKEAGWLRRIVRDYDLQQTVKNTVLFTVLSVPVEFLTGLSFALLISLPLRGRSLSRLGVLIPWALPTAVMAMSWQWLFNNPFGVVNDLLIRAGFLAQPLDWLSSPTGALFVAVFADVWKTFPFVTIVLLAGLQSVPRELHESLAMDGAGPSGTFFHLTLPLLLPFIRVALIFRVLHAAGIFDLLWVLTKGGPADSTRTLSLYIYDLAFQYDELGYAVFLTLLFIGVLVLTSFVIVRTLTLKYEKL